MTDEFTHSMDPVEIPINFTYPDVMSPPPPKREPRTVKLRWFATAIALAVVAAAGLTFLLTRPSVSSLQGQLTATQDRLDSAQADLDATSEVADACSSGVQSAERTLDNWNSYMQDVQDLMLVTTQEDAKKVMSHLTTSYRQVVERKIPTAQALDECQNAQHKSE